MSENQNETPTMDEAVEETRDLIDRMASAIKSVKGSQTAINAQDIPNEIRDIINQSHVTKTYYDVRTYLSDIGDLLKPYVDLPSGVNTINAQDFPDIIQNLDTRYLAPNGEKYYYKYHYKADYPYQSGHPDIDYYTNVKIGGTNADGYYYMYEDGSLQKLRMSDITPGVYTCYNGASYSGGRDPIGRQGGSGDLRGKCIDACGDYHQGCVNGHSISHPTPSSPYPENYQSDFPIFSTEQELIAYLTS